MSFVNFEVIQEFRNFLAYVNVREQIKYIVDINFARKFSVTLVVVYMINSLLCLTSDIKVNMISATMNFRNIFRNQ